MQETYGTIPYLCFKQTQEGLKNEEEKKSLLIDIKPQFGSHPEIRPDFGYRKIKVDLRQIPRELIMVPNQDYLFITYKSIFFDNFQD